MPFASQRAKKQARATHRQARDTGGNNKGGCEAGLIFIPGGLTPSRARVAIADGLLLPQRRGYCCCCILSFSVSLQSSGVTSLLSLRAVRSSWRRCVLSRHLRCLLIVAASDMDQRNSSKGWCSTGLNQSRTAPETNHPPPSRNEGRTRRAPSGGGDARSGGRHAHPKKTRKQKASVSLMTSQRRLPQRHTQTHDRSSVSRSLAVARIALSRDHSQP